MIGPMQWTDPIRDTLQAAVNRIIPADDYPNAWDAGVGDYIDRMLSGDLNRFQQTFLDGLAVLEAKAISQFGKAFAAITLSQQDQILHDVETTSAEFFRLLLELTAEGYYCDPSGGGNRGMISWKMIGFDPKGQAP